MRTIKLVLAYEGTAYHGWQRQPDRPTVQATVERAVGLVTREWVPVHGSGRTDAGVHALGQVAHFRTSSSLAPDVLVRALNANLPFDVTVRSAGDEPEDFHARYSARRKTYFYQLYVAPERDPFLRRHHLHLRRWPDIDRMRAAAALLVGRHDFRSFATEGHLRDDTVRNLERLRVLASPRGLRIFATADGFLQHMVRALCGLLLRVGSGSEAPERVPEILAARCRTRAPAALPAHALVLWRVDY